MAWSLSGRRFAPRLVWTLLALAGIALFVSLGRWQLDRAEQKRALFEGFSAGDAPALELRSTPSNAIVASAPADVSIHSTSSCSTT